ncbi:MAG: M20/M25/M40 family metallo-hydrolase [Ginsengibacter sp.]
MKSFLFFVVLFSYQSLAQKLKKADKELLNNLKAHISFLADDKLEGRRTGSNGEKLAYNYLSAQFKTIGLLPKGDSGSYLQPFTFDDGKEINKTTHLIINGNDLEINKEFFPLDFSPNKYLEAAPVMAFQEKGMPWFLDIKQLLNESKNNPHFDINDYLHVKAKEVSDKGATALIIYNSTQTEDDMAFNDKQKSTLANIPVIYVTKTATQKYLLDTSTALDVKLKIDIEDRTRTGHNVIGYIDNAAANTIIIGAHYDHLGYGEDHNSLWTGTAAINNGADDNASGTAAVIELARWVKKNGLKKNNYLFICFSGEELGLFGSKYFIDHSPIDVGKIDYMINLDMIGRLNDSSKNLMIGGYGTSPTWIKVLSASEKSFSLKFDSSGVGPSDHTSFYRKDIPVLFFFTGIHSDYHKPGDDVDKINFTGAVYIIKFISKILQETNKPEKLVFTKTRESEIFPARFTVTLGIMPDYSYNGNGVRADGISDGKIAQKAGIKAGDIITSFDDFKTYDLNSYMKALSKYKKGDAAKVKVLRGNEELSFDIIFF